MSMNSALRALNLQVNTGGMETLLMPTCGEIGLGWGKALQAKLPTSNHHSLCLAAGSAQLLPNFHQYMDTTFKTSTFHIFLPFSCPPSCAPSISSRLQRIF